MNEMSTFQKIVLTLALVGCVVACACAFGYLPLDKDKQIAEANKDITTKYGTMVANINNLTKSVDEKVADYKGLPDKVTALATRVDTQAKSIEELTGKMTNQIKGSGDQASTNAQLSQKTIDIETKLNTVVSQLEGKDRELTRSIDDINQKLRDAKVKGF